jgi:hypothetical protein
MGWVVSVTPQAALLPPGKGPPVSLPIVQEAGWAPEPVWTPRIVERSSCLCRGSNIDRPVVQPIVRHYTDWANPVTNLKSIRSKNEFGVKTFVCQLSDTFDYVIFNFIKLQFNTTETFKFVHFFMFCTTEQCTFSLRRDFNVEGLSYIHNILIAFSKILHCVHNVFVYVHIYIYILLHVWGFLGCGVSTVTTM